MYVHKRYLGLVTEKFNEGCQKYTYLHVPMDNRQTHLVCNILYTEEPCSFVNSIASLAMVLRHWHAHICLPYWWIRGDVYKKRYLWDMDPSPEHSRDNGCYSFMKQKTMTKGRSSCAFTFLNIYLEKKTIQLKALVISLS